MRCARGQGTVEYLAVVLLVTLVVGGGSAAVARATGTHVAGAVPHQVLYAICLVTRGDCERDRAPCDIGSRTDTHRWSATIAVLTGGQRRMLIREERSDGKVVVTEAAAPLGGVEAIGGAGVKFKLGHRTLGLGGEASAAVIAAWGHGRTWVLGAREADALIVALAAGDPVPAADQDFREGELSIAGTAAGGVGDRAELSGGIGVAGTVGRRIDHATGRRTYFLEAGAGAELTVSLRALRAMAEGAAADRERYALTIDRSGRWVDLAVLRTGEASGTVTLPAGLKPVAETLNAPTSGGRRWIAETHLDLADPGNLAAARAFVENLRAVPPQPRALQRAAAALSGRLDERGIVDVRTYALDRTATGVGGHVGAVLGIGGDIEHTIEKTRLIAATTRGLEGRWQRRDDCLEEVHG